MNFIDHVYVGSQNIEIIELIIKTLIFMNFENEENKEYEWLVQNATKPGIKDWAKENSQYLELLELTKVKWMTQAEQINILKCKIEQDLSESIQQSNLI